MAKKQVQKYANRSARAKTAKKRGKREVLGKQGNLDSLRDAQPATSRLFQ